MSALSKAKEELLEPYHDLYNSGSGHVPSELLKASYSQAISLKRIADSLEKISQSFKGD